MTPSTPDPNKLLAEATAERDAALAEAHGWKIQLGKIASLVPVSQIVRVTGTTKDLIEWLTDRVAVADRADTLAAEVLALRAKDEAAQKLAEALQMISAEAKEDNSVMGRSVFKSLKTCGDVADIALAAYALTQKEAGK